MKPMFNILVVDDDLKNIQVGINFLKQNTNYHLVFATSGEQALERVKETSFDLILLDIMMPVLDGFEVCKILKADEQTKQIPVIFLTAKHEEDSVMEGFKVGGADYITKPFNAAELNARVKTHLELHYFYQQEIAKLKEVLMYSQKAETIKFIAGGVAHDCKNFLTVVPYNLEMLEKISGEKQDSSDHSLELIHDTKVAISRVSGLIDHFFSLNKDDKGDSELVDMNEVAADISKVYKDWLRHNIDFSIELLSQPALTMANKLHVEQVLLNLLINAQHAVMEKMDNGQTDGTIRLLIERVEQVGNEELRQNMPYLQISVIDNGIGIREKSLEQIFDAFFTTKEDRGGSGLGLAVSKHILKTHEGAIFVDSIEGKGTTFTIYLPFAELS